MSMHLPTSNTILALLADFDLQHQSYRIEGGHGVQDLKIQAWFLQEELNHPWKLELLCLSLFSDLEGPTLRHKELDFSTSHQNARTISRRGLISAVNKVDADGGLHRYHVIVEPWTASLNHEKKQRTWKNQNIRRVIDEVLQEYPLAFWQWSPDLDNHFNPNFPLLESASQEIIQDDETDWAFIERLLTDAGLIYQFVSTQDDPCTLCLEFLPHSTTNETLCSGAMTYGDQSSRQYLPLVFDPSERHSDVTDSLYPICNGKPAIGLERSDYGAYLSLDHQNHPSSPRSSLHEQEAPSATHLRLIGKSHVQGLKTGQFFQLRHRPSQNLPEVILGESSEYLVTKVRHVGLNELSSDLHSLLNKLKLDARTANGFWPQWMTNEHHDLSSQHSYLNELEAEPAHLMRQTTINHSGNSKSEGLDQDIKPIARYQIMPAPQHIPHRAKW